MNSGERTPSLQRVVGLPGAVLLGLGSMIGTGVFVSIGIAAGIAGSWVVTAIAIAAAVALCNGLSSAQLAAVHPVSGGTYEYGYRYLSPPVGFTAGWTFLLAKSASAATAALGFSGYLLRIAGWSSDLFVPVAVAVVLLVVAIVLAGLRRSNVANAVIVLATLVSLLVFVALCLPHIEPANLLPSGSRVSTFSHGDLFSACALMFVAFTGYGRVATLGEEVRDPAGTIPRAIVTVVLVTMLLYIAVAVAAVGSVDAVEFGRAADRGAAPLAAVATALNRPVLALLVSIGGMVAMFGVLLNLTLGLSRVLLAMGRRGDMPSQLATLNPSGTTPTAAVLLAGGIVGLLTLVGDVKTTWSFSAFSVLIYYGITNLAALQLPAAQRRFPSWIPLAGLLFCLFLAFHVETEMWLVGLGLIAAGLCWHAIAQHRGSSGR